MVNHQVDIKICFRFSIKSMIGVTRLYMVMLCQSDSLYEIGILELQQGPQGETSGWSPGYVDIITIATF